ncbi:MAG: 23S rRNA (uracil(1939)-C(5))-methyltransferase RlmD [Myxococcota bacterium]|nr:23S rRNA (uracil(1939)-C(5))-methyltransferase RlmD [Myxococcota bacterium]
MSDSSDSGSSKPKSKTFKARGKSFSRRKPSDSGSNEGRRGKRPSGKGKPKNFGGKPRRRDDEGGRDGKPVRGDRRKSFGDKPRRRDDEGGRDGKPFRGDRRKSFGDKSRRREGEDSRDGKPFKGDRRKPSGKRRTGRTGEKVQGRGRDQKGFKRTGRKPDGIRRGFRGRRDSGSNKGAFREQQEMTLTPTHWGTQGEAILETTSEDGKARRTIVWRGIPGEKARVRVLREGQNQRYTEVLSVTGKVDEGRRTPKCDKMDACGGCPMMHLSLSGQHSAKLSIVKSLFDAEDVGDYAPTEILEAKKAKPWDYRHTLKVAVDTTQEGHLRLGVRGRRGHVVPIPKCHVVTPLLRKVLKAVAFYVTGKSELITRKVMAYGTDSDNPTVGLRYVVIRQSSGPKPEVQLCFVVGKYSALYRDVADAVMRQCPEVVSVSVHINRTPGNSIFLREVSEPETFISQQGEEREERYPNGSFAILTGRETIEEEVGGFHYQIGAGDFFQVNPVVAKQLQDAVVNASEEYQGHAIVDLYCGVGLLTVPLAKKHGWAIGVEGGEGATARAHSNARINGVTAEFSSGDVGDSLAGVRRRLAGRTPVVVVDPARRGLEEGVLEQIIALNPLKLIYVSCGPRALARDTRALLSLGWTVESTAAFDMFPHTAHVEMVAVFRPPHVTPSALQGPRRHFIRK